MISSLCVRVPVTSGVSATATRVWLIPSWMHQLCHLAACMHECLSITAMLCLHMLMCINLDFPSVVVLRGFPLDMHMHSMLLACLEYVIKCVFIGMRGVWLSLCAL